MKNIKKFIKEEVALVRVAIIVKALSFTAFVAARIPGGAAYLYTLIKTNLDEEAKRLMSVLFINGEESETFQKACQIKGARYTRKALKLIKRAHTIYVSLGLLAMSEKLNELFEKEEP